MQFNSLKGVLKMIYKRIPMFSYILYLMPCILFLVSSAIALEPKTGPRPLGMSAYSAVADDINAISWNPAGLSLLQNQEIVADYTPLYGFDTEISQSHLAYAYPMGRIGTIGMDLSYLGYGDLDWRDDQGHALGIFSRKDYSIIASYGMRMIESLSLGASMEVISINTDLAESSKTALGFDLGLMYTLLSRASFGLYLENVGGVKAGEMQIARQKVRTGAAFSILNRPGAGLVVAFDLDEQQGKVDTLYSGFELSLFSPSSFFVKRKLQERSAMLGKYEGMADYREGLPEQSGKIGLCIRGGMQKRLAVDEPMSFSGGVSIRYLLKPKSSALKLEHAFTWHPYLDTTHRIALSLELGRMIL